MAAPKVHFVSLITGKDFIDNDPRVESTVGNSVAGEVPWFKALDDATAVEALIQEAKAYGCSGLKLYADITVNNTKRIIAAAKQINFPFWAHGTLFPGSPWVIVGVHSFSHAPFLAYVPEERVPSMRETLDEDFREPFDLEAINSSKMEEYLDLMKENKMKKIILSAVIFMAFGSRICAQIDYSVKVETGYLDFKYRLIIADPSNLKGFYLNDRQNGIDLNVINGISFNNNKLVTGIGIGYVNFEKINGLSIFTDFEYIPLKTKLSPTVNLRIGYNHIWNQYENGTGEILFEFGGGINYKMTEKLNLYLQSGILTMQQSSFFTVRIGIKL